MLPACRAPGNWILLEMSTKMSQYILNEVSAWSYFPGFVLAVSVEAIFFPDVNSSVFLNDLTFAQD